MKKASLQPEILQYIDMLGHISQQKVLAYIKTLVNNPGKGKRKNSILEFAGIFSKKDLKEINSAIEEGCEQVDKNEW